MIALTAILRSKAGQADALCAALAEMTDYIERDEPGTVGFYVSQALDDPNQFVTYERFRDEAAMETHNNSAYRDSWVAKYGDLFDGELTIYICRERAAKH